MKKVNKFEQSPPNRIEEQYRFDSETSLFPSMIKYKDAIYGSMKDKGETAEYTSMLMARSLNENQPYSIEVDKDGNVLSEY